MGEKELKKFLHDLSQPVGAILGYTEILIEELKEKGYDEDEKIKKATEHIKTGCNKMLEIFHEFRENLNKI